jgi:micrococcal nuclease
MKLSFVALFFISYASAAQLTGKVVSIADGDTFTLLSNNKQIKIRLHGIDCPEKSQDFGNVAKQFLSNLIFGKIVSVKEMDTDRYGRTIGMVTIDNKNVNEELLKAGLAWHYKHYDQNPAWMKLEDDARREKKGLWLHPNPIPPWDYRKMK